MDGPAQALSFSANYFIIVRAFFLLFGLVLFLASGCTREFGGDRLFELLYPVVDIPVPAGISSFTTHVAAQPELPVNLRDEMQRTSTVATDIDYLGGLRARLTSLNGEDFGELERIELRACPVGQSRGCSQFDIMFSVSDLFNRRDQVVNLSPSPIERNFSELFLANDAVRIEVVFFPAQTTSRVVEARLEWSIHAVGNLD